MNVLKHNPDSSMMEPLHKRLRCDIPSCPRGLLVLPPVAQEQQNLEQNIMSSNDKLEEVGVDGQILAAVSHSSHCANSANPAPSSCNSSPRRAGGVHSSCPTTSTTPSSSPLLASTRVSSSNHTASLSCLNHDQEQGKDRSSTKDQDERQQCASTTTATEALLLLVGPNNTKSNYEEGRHRHHQQRQEQEEKENGRRHERAIERPAINMSEKEISDDEPADSLVHGHEDHEHQKEDGESQRRHDNKNTLAKEACSPTSNRNDNGDKNQRPIVMNNKTAHNKSMIDNAASSNHCHVNILIAEKNESISSEDSIDKSIVFLEGPKKFPIKVRHNEWVENIVALPSSVFTSFFCLNQEDLLTRRYETYS